MRFPIRFGAAYALLSRALLIPPEDSYVELRGDGLHVRMAWAFRATFPRSAVARARRLDTAPLSRGVHGFAGRWLVNGSGDGLVALELTPTQRAYVIGVPVTLRELTVSVDDPERFAQSAGGRA